MTAQIASIIARAVARGFTASTILQHLSRNFPQYASTISKASAMGYAADKILKHLVNPRGKNPDNSDDYLTESEKADKSTKQNKRRAALGLGAAALTATGLGVGLAGGLSSTAAQLLPMLGQTPQGPPPPTAPTAPTNPPLPGAPINPPAGMPQSSGQMAAPQTPMPGPQIGQQIAQGVQQPVQQAMQPTTQAEMGQAAQAMPQQSGQLGQQLPSIFEELTKNVDVQSLSPEKVKQLQFVKTISDKLEQEGKPITDPAFQGVAKKIKSILQGKPGTVIEETARVSGVQPEKKQFLTLEKDKEQLKGKTTIEISRLMGIGYADAAKIKDDLDKNYLGQESPTVKKPKDVQKGDTVVKNSIVSTPNGVGEVKGLSNGKAIVDIDGKAHKVDEKDIEPSPIPEKDLSDLYDDLIKGMEKETGEDVSRMVQWAGYNPETNTLQFLPHSGKLYKYGDISPEDAALLTDILSTRKTTGANFIGAWKAGSKSPIGAALSKLIRKLQTERGGKGKEYEETHEPIYSAYEPAIEAKKRKKKKK